MNDIELRKSQQLMHKDFFDNCKFAMDNGFNLEAVFMEYAAIEGRLEVILGVLGCPCNKDAPDNLRKEIKISHRIGCLKRIYRVNGLFNSGKLDKAFFERLEKWTKERNQFIHGLYKNVVVYESRKAQFESQAIEGLDLAKVLYDEAKRLRRLNKDNRLIISDISCSNSGCKLNPKNFG